MDDFDDTQMQYSGWHSTFEEKRNEMKPRFGASFRAFSIISIVTGIFFGAIFMLAFYYIINRIIRMHTNSSETNRIRTRVPVNNTENMSRPVATTPAMTSFTPNRNNRQYLPLNDVREDQHARPIGFDVGIDLDRSSRTAQENGSSSLNNIRVDRYARPTGSDGGMDLDRSSRNTQDNHSYSLNNITVDQYARPIGFDVGTDDRSFRNTQDNHSYSFNNIRVDQYARPIGFDVGIDLDRISRSAQDNRNLPRMGDVQLLSSDEPPAYSTVLSDGLSGNTFPPVSIRVSPESSLPNLN